MLRADGSFRWPARSLKDMYPRAIPLVCDQGSGGAAVDLAARRVHGNENVGGIGHACGMNKSQIMGADTRSALELWFLSGPPLVDVHSQAHLR
jgi:hypothetical protein